MRSNPTPRAPDYFSHLIHNTPPSERSAFAYDIWKRRRPRYGPSGQAVRAAVLKA
jgi:hypothetical protein